MLKIWVLSFDLLIKQLRALLLWWLGLTDSTCGSFSLEAHCKHFNLSLMMLHCLTSLPSWLGTDCSSGVQKYVVVRRARNLAPRLWKQKGLLFQIKNPSVLSCQSAPPTRTSARWSRRTCFFRVREITRLVWHCYSRPHDLFCHPAGRTIYRETAGSQKKNKRRLSWEEDMKMFFCWNQWENSHLHKVRWRSVYCHMAISLIHLSAVFIYLFFVLSPHSVPYGHIYAFFTRTYQGLGENLAVRLSAFTAVQVDEWETQEAGSVVELWVWWDLWSWMKSSIATPRSCMFQGCGAPPAPSRFYWKAIPRGVQGPSGEDAWGSGFFSTYLSPDVGELAGKLVQAANVHLITGRPTGGSRRAPLLIRCLICPQWTTLSNTMVVVLVAPIVASSASLFFLFYTLPDKSFWVSLNN